MYAIKDKKRQEALWVTRKQKWSHLKYFGSGLLLNTNSKNVRKISKNVCL